MQTKTKIPGTDIDVKEFQQWLRDTYGEKVELGLSGKSKDGVDGILGDKTKKAWEQYGKLYKPLTSTTPIGTKKLPLPNNSVDLTELIKINPKETGLSETDELFKKLSAENIQKTMAKDKSDATMLKNKGIADLLPTALGGLYGISQLAQQKKLTPPKRVEPMLPNQQLNTLLAQVGVNANMADPKIREQAIRDITNNREVANEMARVGSGGDITAFSQNAQNNYLKSNDAIRKLASDESNDILKNRALFGNLLATKMAEDRTNHNERVSNFNNIDMPEFEKARAYNANLSNSGMKNLFGAVQNGVDNSPLLGGYNNIMSGYKARYATMSPEEKKAFRINYPKLASKYDAELLSQNTTETPVITTNNVIPIPTPQQLPAMPLSYNWTM